MNASSIKNPILRRSYLLLVLPIVVCGFPLVVVYEIGRAVWDKLSDIPANLCYALRAFSYCWTGQEEMLKRQEAKELARKQELAELGGELGLGSLEGEQAKFIFKN